ncbi:hypothetical protein [Cellulomonas carbonis]|uniref:Serine kinase n=1 Tax=Cellulomonas carbonis T26 TaxID=947969 RepID=A0A0A0BN62_9CELL|nr:hypothetical protein [Cellulomonas carbonis]KGM08509.1 hypothetical protein N868_08550 [Cellulomonas carbonis T26]GGC05523.1 hypothetical protein GCM10010972_18400 [Cellulomonas carbonis]
MAGERAQYGLRLRGLDGVDALLRPADPAWPVLTVRPTVGARSLTADEVTEERAAYRLERADGDVHVDRVSLTATFVMTREHPPEAYLHPFLSLTTAVVSRWLDRDALHAGAFLAPSGVWGVLGAREAGKSTALATLHARGHAVLADDVVVVDGGQVLPGPACLDLREEAARRLATGDGIGVVGARERWRVRLDPEVRPGPLVGWVLPQWGDEHRVEVLRPAERLGVLMANLALSRVPRRPERVMDLARVPVVRWVRPRSWSEADRALDSLLAVVG